MTLQFIQEDRQGIELLLEKLIPLSQVSLAGQLAMRVLDPANVEALFLSDSKKWPPVSITRMAQGYILYDGQHRMEAARQKGMTSILANCRTFSSENELIDATFRANLRHGLQASKEYRSDYAYWLYLTFRSQMTQEQIAARAGITQSVVSKAIARREKRLREAALGEDGNQEERPEAIKRFLKGARKFYDALGSDDYEVLVRALHDQAKKPEDRDALYFVGQLLLDAAKPPVMLVHKAQR